MAKYNKNQQQEQNVNKIQQKYSQQSQDDESYVPKSLKITKKHSQTKQPKSSVGKTQTFNNSLWSLKQNYAYMSFLKENQHYFAGSWQYRKSIKINVMMSRAIGTRSPAQCRSHHQKMMKYHESIPKIINYILELQSAAHVAQPEFHKEEPTAHTLSSDAVLQDLSEKWVWMEDYQDLWNKMMDEKWIEGADEYFSFKQS